MTRRPLRIGLVNLMPPAAMRATERQFAQGLAAAGGEFMWRLFAPGPADGYEALAALAEARLDGLVVSGAPPAGGPLETEPCWPDVGALVDWAAAHTVSTLWSCLAAHAAVYRLSGLHRVRLARKLSGVFEVAKTEADALTAALPARWVVPHSRFYGLEEAALARAGYRILSRGAAAGVDGFSAAAGRSVFLFLQGHPEYEAETLAGEYQRDLRRFLAGRSACRPRPPVFEAISGGGAPACGGAVMLGERPAWRAGAIGWFQGWLGLLRDGAA